MARYGWIIDKDFAPDPMQEPPCNANAVGVMGPRDAPQEILDALRVNKDFGLRFRMAYDDPPDPDEYPEYPVMYEGRCHVDQPPGYDLSEDYFGPLTDFGTPNVGAAWIFYWNEDVQDWIQL